MVRAHTPRGVAGELVGDPRRRRASSKGPPTLLYDEIDTIFGPRAREHEDILALLNAGHRPGAMAHRCVVRGKEVLTEDNPAFSTVALAGLDRLPDTLMTRSVVVNMRRRGPTEHVDPFRRRINGPEGELLRERLAAWAEQARPLVERVYPTPPSGVTGPPMCGSRSSQSPMPLAVPGRHKREFRMFLSFRLLRGRPETGSRSVF